VGNIRDGLYQKNIQLKSKVKNIEAFGEIPIAKQGVAIIYLKDVAKITHGAKELESLAKYNGQRIVGLNIFKAQEQNSIQVVKAVKEKLKDIAEEIPKGTKIDIVRDSSIPIDKAVKNVFYTIIEGALLTILIVFLFLNSWRSTVITGLTLPVSLIGTFLFMYWFGFTINMITLMALSICVGLLIDDAIVVRENIVRHIRMGKDHKTASLEGTQEIGLAVLATTFSIVAVFLPVGFMGGIIGQFFHQFGITVVVAVLISMFVSFTLDPMLSSVWPDPVKPIARWNLISRFAQWFEERMEDLANFYQKLLRIALGRRLITVFLSILILVFSVYSTKFIGKEFVPAADYSEMVLNYSTPSGSSLEYTEKKSQQIEKVLKAIPEIKNMYSTINAGGTSGKNNVRVYIKLFDKKERQAKNQRSTHELNQAVRESLQSIAGIRVTNAGAINPVGKNKLIEISLQGPDLKVMEQIAAQTLTKLEKIPGLVDIDSSNKELRKIYAVRVNQDLAFDQNLTPQRISTAIKPLFEGEVVSTWRAEDGEDYDVRLKMNAQNRQLDQLKTIPLLYQNNTNQNQLLSLEQLATVEMDFGANQINRKNLSREIQIDANTHGRASGDVNTDVQKVLDSIKMPAGYKFDVGGDSKDMKESGMYAMQALALGVIFIYMVIASQFGRFIQPLSIMSSLPFTLIGVVGALYLFQSSLNLFSIIGVVMLMGLVTKNAILLIDYANQLQREENYNINDSLIEAAKVRLRPILMTTLAMIFGMVPLALGLAEGSEQRAPMGQAIIGGVITSSLLSLVVVPVIYSLLENMILRIKSKRNKKHDKH
jgi:hydrophobic/amphiphilic exporter-1 (mainly G- bacteria), HAE1 family